MGLPFTRDAFLDVFALYNTSLWPFAVLLWAATAIAFAAHATGRDRTEWTFGLLAVHWGWAAVAYHALLFSRINPAAWLFAALFLAEACLLVWYALPARKPRFSHRKTARERVAYILIAYGLFYPVVTLAGGHSYPRTATFGVPCPTTIVTAGFLMLVSRLPPALTVVPLVWAMVGGSAAFLLGMPADLALPAAGIALGTCAWRRQPGSGASPS